MKPDFLSYLLKAQGNFQCDIDTDDQQTTPKRRRKTLKSRSRSPATPDPQDLQISSSGPKDPMPKLKALMSVEESKSTNPKRKKSHQKESRSRSKDRSPESHDKDAKRSKWDAFDIHPMDQVSMSKRAVSDYRPKSPEWSPLIRRSSGRDVKYTHCSSPEISDSSKSRLRSNIEELERESRSTRSRSRERLASYRSRSRERLSSKRSRSRERLASKRSRSRERLASYRSRSRVRPVSYRSRSPERLSSNRSRSRERLASKRSRSQERLASYRSRSRERDPSREKNRPLAIMPKSPEIIRSLGTRRVSLTTTSQSKEATITKYNSDANITIFVDVIPRKPLNGDKNKTIDDSHHDPSGEIMDNMKKNTISDATDRFSDPGVSIISWECTEKKPVPEKINNLTITEVIDVDNEDSHIKNDVDKTASNDLTITEETIEIKDIDADIKDIIIKDETKPSKAKSKRVTKTAFIDITFDKDFCPIPARPQFVLVLKKLMKQMKNTIKTADKKGLREFPISMFKCALRTMLKNLVAGKGYLGTSEIVKLFRAKYPKEEDHVLINQVIEDIKMGKYGKYTEVGQPQDKDDDKDDVILIEDNCDVIVLGSDDEVDEIKSDQKPNLDDVKPIESELQNTQHVEAVPTLQSQDKCKIVKTEPNSGEFVNCTEEPIENIKQEIEPEFTDAAVENLLDSLKDFDNLNNVNDTEKETPQVTAITIMTSFSELISLKNEINQSSDKVGNVSTDIEANEIKIENDLISNTMIKTECVPDDKQYGHEISPNEERDNNVRIEANDVRNNNYCNKVIQDRETEKPNESGPTVVDACTTTTKTVSRGDEEETIESITKYLDSVFYY